MGNDAAGPQSPNTDAPQREELKRDAIGFVDALVIGLNATSPAYSLAAVIGPIVVLVGVAAPGVLLASFVPMLLIASAFYYMNKVDQDCGTTFSWATRAMGPWWSWQGGWAITMTGVLVVGALADVAVRFALLMFGLDHVAYPDDAEPRYWWYRVIVMALTVGLIVLMMWLCVLGPAAIAPTVRAGFRRTTPTIPNTFPDCDLDPDLDPGRGAPRLSRPSAQE